jgi:hypothetical protein
MSEAEELYEQALAEDARRDATKRYMEENRANLAETPHRDSQMDETQSAAPQKAPPDDPLNPVWYLAGFCGLLFLIALYRYIDCGFCG